MKGISKVWVFKSDTSDKQYQTLLYKDGSTSCDCPGWTKRSQRTCKHTRYVDCNLADSLCAAVTDYNATKKPPAPSISTTPEAARRKFDLTA